MPELTIAIPTYDRNDILNRTLLAFLPHIPAELPVLIIDNASPRPVAETAQPVLDKFPGHAIRILRNDTNIGAGANVMRCIELAETEWVWVLGDEDVPAPDALAVIDKAIAANPDAIFLHFSAREFFMRETSVSGRGLREFLRRMDRFSAVLFISMGILNRRKLAPAIAQGYRSADTYAPHVAALLDAMQPGDAWLYDTEPIVTRGHPGDASQAFSLVPVAMGLPLLLEIPAVAPCRSILRRKLGDTLRDWMQPERLAFELLVAFEQGREAAPLDMFRQVRARCLSTTRQPGYVVRFHLAALMLIFPDTAMKLLPPLLRLIGREAALKQFDVDRSARL